MVNEELIVKFLAGEAEDHEVVMLNQWRQTSAENEAQFAQLEKLWNTSAAVSDKTKFNTDAAWRKVSTKIETPSKTKVVPMRRVVWYAAASLIILFSLSAVLFNVFQQEPLQYSSVSGDQILKLDLSDGSKVTLKEGSLVYPKVFEGNTRGVELNKGKAYFKITRNPERPFEIKTENSVITVLGTEFEVNTDKDFTHVRVNSGKVRFESPAGEVILTAGKSAKYNKKTGKLENLKETPDNSLSYATGKLEFSNLSLKEVVADLNNYYPGREIELASHLENCRLTASFQNDKLENVLEVIRVTMELDVDWDKTSGRYIISGKGCLP